MATGSNDLGGVRDKWTRTTVAETLMSTPNDVPSVLRRLHFTRNTGERYDYVGSLALVLNNEDSGREWHALHESHIANTLLDIIKNEFLCGYSEDEILEGFSTDVQMKAYIAHYSLLLVLYLKFLAENLEVGRAGPTERCTVLMLKSLPAVWDALWTVRQILVNEAFADDFSISSLVVDLVEAHSELHNLFCRKPLSIMSRAPHVMFMVFTHHKSNSLRDRAIHLCNRIICHPDVTHSDRQQFFRAIISCDDEAKGAIYAFRHVLRNRATLGGNFGPIMETLAVWLSRIPLDSISWSAFQHTDGLIDALVGALERERCSGLTEQEMLTTVRCCIVVLNRIVFVRRKDSGRERSRLSLTAQNALVLLDALALCATEVAMHQLRDPDCQQMITVLFGFDFERSIINLSTYEKYELSHVLYCSRSCVLEALQRLNTLDTPSDRSIPRLYFTMVELARKLGWQVPEGPNTLRHPIANNNHELRLQGCHNVRCMCFGRKPSHPLYVCKGCWLALYCSQQCQKIAWEEDHRNICVGFETRKPRPPRWTAAEMACTECNCAHHNH